MKHSTFDALIGGPLERELGSRVWIYVNEHAIGSEETAVKAWWQVLEAATAFGIAAMTSRAGKSNSVAKAAAARVNGTKGGRPRQKKGRR